MFVKPEVFNLLLDLIKNDDAAALRFFLRWEKDRRQYLLHRTNDGLTLLHHACLAGKRNVVHCLVDCGADIEVRSSVGWSALHAAALSGCYDVVSYLLRGCAANPLVKDDMGCVPHDLTLESRITTMLKDRIEEIKAAAEKYDTARAASVIEAAESKHATTNTLTRRNTLPITQRLNHPDIFRVRSDSNISRRTKFEKIEEVEETKSLPGDVMTGLIGSGRRRTGSDGGLARSDYGINGTRNEMTGSDRRMTGSDSRLAGSSSKMTGSDSRVNGSSRGMTNSDSGLVGSGCGIAKIDRRITGSDSGLVEKPTGISKLEPDQLDINRSKRDSGIFEDLSYGPELITNEKAGPKPTNILAS